MHWIGPLDVADTKWILVSVPATVRPSLGHGSAWLLMIAGLLLTGVVIAFLWSSARYALTLLQANQKDLRASTDRRAYELAEPSSFG